MTAVVNIGFQSLKFITQENSSAVATVCAQIDRGSLERQVVAYLSTTTVIGDRAVGMFYYTIMILLYFDRFRSEVPPYLIFHIMFHYLGKFRGQ